MPVSKEWDDYPGRINITDDRITFPDGSNLLAAPVFINASYIRTTDGVQTLLAAAPYSRSVMILVKVVTTFAAGDGTAPVFDFGETDTDEKYKADLNTGSAETVLTYFGALSANKALIATATAATGLTSTGAIDVTALVLGSN